MSDKTAKEVERVSRIVGKEGKITHRAAVPAASGSWLRLVDSTNLLIDDLARPTSEMARVIGAVANGDLSERMALQVDERPLKGEFLRTVKIVNSMVDQLSSFASEVTRVAREVGTEGKLGGKARVKGVAGTWKDLTDSVNSMASNLTSQVRNIAEVTTAVANGDLSKKITDRRGFPQIHWKAGTGPHCRKFPPASRPLRLPLMKTPASTAKRKDMPASCSWK